MKKSNGKSTSVRARMNASKKALRSRGIKRSAEPVTQAETDEFRALPYGERARMAKRLDITRACLARYALGRVAWPEALRKRYNKLKEGGNG